MENTVLAIRNLDKEGFSNIEIAKILSVSLSYVVAITGMYS